MIINCIIVFWLFLHRFRDRECIEEKFYPDGKLAYRFELNSTGKVLYKSGHPAMTFTQNYLGNIYLLQVWYLRTLKNHSYCRSYN